MKPTALKRGRWEGGGVDEYKAFSCMICIRKCVGKKKLKILFLVASLSISKPWLEGEGGR